MKRKLFRRAATFLAGAALLLCTACAEWAAATSMRLAGTEGETSVRNEEKKELELAADMKLYSGYGLETKPAGYLWVNLDSVKLAKLDENSDVEIQKSGKKLDLLLHTGKLFFQVTEPLAEDESMYIRSSTMAVGIRGTCGWVEATEPGQMRVYLLEGTVECSITDPDTGETLAQSLTAGERALLTLKDGKAEITVEKFTEKDIPYFVTVDLEKDPELKKAVEDQLKQAAENLPPEASGSDGASGTDGSKTSGTGTDSPESAEIATIKTNKTDLEYVNGNQKGQVIVTLRDGMYGAVNLKGEEIVPNSYSSYYRTPNNQGQFVLGNGTDAFVFDNQGNMILEVPEDLTGAVAENAVTYVHMNAEGMMEACCYDIAEGRQTLRIELEDEDLLGPGAGITGLQDGMFYLSSIGDQRLRLIRKDGTVVWTDEEYETELLDIWNEKQEQAGSESESDSDSGFGANAGGMSSFLYDPGYPVQSPNGGYMVCAPWLEASLFRIFDCSAKRFLRFWTFEEGDFIWNKFDEFWPQSFYHDGHWYANKGSQIIMRGFISGTEEATDYLVDFSNAQTDELGNVLNLPDLILAEYPYIRLAGDGYYHASDGESFFYLDERGNRMDASCGVDCTGFYMGHAMILEDDGMAYVIDKSFEKLSEGYPADRVSLAGGMFCATKGDEQTFIMVR